MKTARFRPDGGAGRAGPGRAEWSRQVDADAYAFGVSTVTKPTDGKGDIVFSSPMLIRRQFPAAWLAGGAVSIRTGSGTAVRLILADEWTGLLAWAVGALFIPSLALALGLWSRNSRFFEAVYTAIGTWDRSMACLRSTRWVRWARHQSAGCMDTIWA